MGRPKGSPNKTTIEFKALMQSILFSDVTVTRRKLEELRDSIEPQDRSTFWRLAAKLIPNTITGKIEIGRPKLIRRHNFAQGIVEDVTEERSEHEQLQ